MVRVAGLEPVPNCSDKNLNLARLPVPPYPHINAPLSERSFLPAPSADHITINYFKEKVNLLRAFSGKFFHIVSTTFFRFWNKCRGVGKNLNIFNLRHKKLSIFSITHCRSNVKHFYFGSSRFTAIKRSRSRHPEPPPCQLYEGSENGRNRFYSRK